MPVADGWSRLQIKRNGKFLDADQCSDNVKLSELSTFADGACQLWRFVPAADGWARLQIKYTGEAAPEEFAYNGNSYGWFDDGWNGPGWYIIGLERIRGRGFGGREGWRGWHHHGSHPHGHGGEPHGGGHPGGDGHPSGGHPHPGGGHPGASHPGGGHPKPPPPKKHH